MPTNINKGDSMTMTDQEILDALVWAVEAIEEDRKLDALDYVTQVRDEYETRQDESNEAIQDNFYADARDHHLINQDLNRALGKVK
jgi:hypothetical protein